MESEKTVKNVVPKSKAEVGDGDQLFPLFPAINRLEKKVRNWIDQIQSYTNGRRYKFIVGLICSIVLSMFILFGFMAYMKFERSMCQQAKEAHALTVKLSELEI
jgi:hypothetical protein